MIVSAGIDELRRLLRNAPPVNPIAACAVAVVFAGYAAGVVRPKLEELRRVRSQIAKLEDRRAPAPAPAADAPVTQSRAAPPAAEAVTRPGELVPAVSRLGRRSGLRIHAIKQTGGNVGSKERRVRVLAEGAFPAVVAFVDGVAALVSHGQLEELALRRSSLADQLELESVLRVKVDEPAAAAPREGGS